MAVYGRLSTSPLELLASVKKLVNFSSLFTETRCINVNSTVLYLHSTITLYILITGTFFLSMKDYFGNSIECLSKDPLLPAGMLQHYCWLDGIFSVIETNEREYKESSGGHSDNAYYGVKAEEQEERFKYHKYYQWVYFLLVVQSLLFYIPKVMNERTSGRIRNILSSVKLTHTSQTNNAHGTNLLSITNAMLIGKRYYCYLYTIEIICLLHVILEIWLTNIIFGNTFINLGYSWLRYSFNNEINRHYDPLLRMFPRKAKCNFRNFGYSGTIEIRDALCFLPLNIVNEKIFLVLWFWYVFLIASLSTLIGIRTLTVIMKYLRYWILMEKSPTCNKMCVRQMSAHLGYWYVLVIIADNIDSLAFSDLLEDLTNALYDSKGKAYKYRLIQNSIERVIKSHKHKKAQLNVLLPVATSSSDNLKTAIKTKTHTNLRHAQDESLPMLTKPSSSFDWPNDSESV